jgi:predicted dehydrogenase
MANKLTAAIIGCGSIGALKDDKYDYPGGANVLTHAHALWKNENTELVALFDTKIGQAEKAAEKWGVKNYYSSYILFNASLDTHRPDIVVMAVPTDYHRTALLDLLEHDHYRPKLVIAEKPFCQNITEAIEVDMAYKKAGIPIAVDYIRRYMPAMRTIKTLVDEMDCIYHARLLYGRGFKHEACHALDMFRYLLGEYVGHAHTFAMRDSKNNEVTITGHFGFFRCRNVQFVGIQSNHYGVFEMEIVGSDKIITLSDSGQYLECRAPNMKSVYDGNAYMSPTPYMVENTGLTRALSGLVYNCVGHLRDNEPLLCTAEDAIQVHNIISKIL